MWSPVGRQVMIPTPAQPTRRYGLGAVDWHGGEVVVLMRRRKRRRESAELLARHPRGTICVAWGNACTHEDEEVEAAVLSGAAGRLALLYLPTYSPRGRLLTAAAAQMDRAPAALDG